MPTSRFDWGYIGYTLDTCRSQKPSKVKTTYACDKLICKNYGGWSQGPIVGRSCAIGVAILFLLQAKVFILTIMIGG